MIRPKARTAVIIFGNMHFLVISDFFHVIKRDGIRSFMEFMTRRSESH